MSSPHTYHGIVLRTIKYSDTQRIAIIYTLEQGTISCIVRKSGKRSTTQSALFQPLTLIEFVTSSKSKTSLQRLKEVKATTPLQSLVFDPLKTPVAFFVAEFIYRAIREEEANAPLFSFLSQSILWFDRSEKGYANFHLVFLLQLSQFLGLYPQLDDFRNNTFFDLQQAEFTTIRPIHGAYIPPKEAQAIIHLMRLNYRTMHVLRLSRTQRNECLRWIIDYYQLHLPGLSALKSIDILIDLFD
jgi:DNA repair protein RecO (recombination protein O)